MNDYQVHALAGNGRWGIKHNIQHFRCQCYRTDIYCQRITPHYFLKTAADRIEMVQVHDFIGNGKRMGSYSDLLHNRSVQGHSQNQHPVTMVDH